MSPILLKADIVASCQVLVDWFREAGVLHDSRLHMHLHPPKSHRHHCVSFHVAIGHCVGLRCPGLKCACRLLFALEPRVHPCQYDHIEEVSSILDMA